MKLRYISYIIYKIFRYSPVKFIFNETNNTSRVNIISFTQTMFDLFSRAVRYKSLQTLLSVSVPDCVTRSLLLRTCIITYTKERVPYSKIDIYTEFLFVRG